MGKVVFPAFSDSNFSPVEMRQFVSALELRFQALEEEEGIFEEVATADFAEIDHTHLEADITDLQNYLVNLNDESILSLQDVVGTANDNDILVYDSSIPAFVSVPPGQSNAVALDDLTDVTVRAPGDGQVLTYNETARVWEGAGTGISITSLDDLLDTDLTGQNKFDMLFNADGTNWHNTAGNLQWNSELMYMQLANMYSINWQDSLGDSIEMLKMDTTDTVGGDVEFETFETFVSTSTASATFVDTGSLDLAQTQFTDGDEILVVATARTWNNNNSAAHSNGYRLIAGTTELTGSAQLQKGRTQGTDGNHGSPYSYAGWFTADTAAANVRTQFHLGSAGTTYHTGSEQSFFINLTTDAPNHVKAQDTSTVDGKETLPTYVTTGTKIDIGPGDWLIFTSQRFVPGRTGGANEQGGFTDGTTNFVLYGRVTQNSGTDEQVMSGTYFLEGFLGGTLEVIANTGAVTGGDSDFRNIIAIPMSDFKSWFAFQGDDTEKNLAAQGVEEDSLASLSFEAPNSANYLAISWLRTNWNGTTTSIGYDIQEQVEGGGFSTIGWDILALPIKFTSTTRDMTTVSSDQRTYTAGDSIDVKQVVFSAQSGWASKTWSDEGIVVLEMVGSVTETDTFLVGDPASPLQLDGSQVQSLNDVGYNWANQSDAFIELLDFGGETLDPFFDDVSVLIPLDGDLSAVGNFPGTWTLQGDAAFEAQAPPSGGTQSLRGFGTNDWAETDYNAAYDFGAEEFTIEGWIRPTSDPTSNNADIISLWETGENDRAYYVAITSGGVNGNLRFAFYNGFADNSVNYLIDTTTAATTWYWFAVVRDKLTGGDDVIRMWWDGDQIEKSDDTLEDMTNESINAGSTSRKLKIGDRGSGGDDLDGHVHDIRITKGVARYRGTGNVTVPTASYPLEEGDGTDIWTVGDPAYDTIIDGLTTAIRGPVLDNDPAAGGTQDSRLELTNLSDATAAALGFSTSIDLDLINNVRGGKIIGKTELAAGGQETSFQTTTAALGGLFANNALTGTGLERVLTEEDTTFARAANLNLTAHVGSSQGDGVITSTYNEYSVVATTGDAATLPTFANSPINTIVWVKNNDFGSPRGNSMDVFPAVGEDAGNGIDTEENVFAGDTKAWIRISSTVWVIWLEPDGGQSRNIDDLQDVVDSGGSSDFLYRGPTGFGNWINTGTLMFFDDTKLSVDGSLTLLEQAAAVADVAAYGQYWVRDDVPNVPMFTDDTGVDYNLLESTGGSSVVAPYRFDTSIVEADPGNGDFRMDNVTPASVTELFISSTTDTGNDFQNLLSFVSSGDQIYIQQDDDATQYIFFDVTANVDNTGWFSIAGTIANSGTLFDSNGKCHILILFGGSGSFGDVFKVGTPVDDQLGIWTGDGTLEGDANLTWDGSELFVLGPAAAAAVTVNAPNPQIRFQESDVAVDEGNWRLIANSSRWRLQTASDGAPEGGAATAFTVERTGFVVDSFDINAPVFSNTGNFDVGTEVLFTERADHVLTPAATRGILWVRDDAPNVLVFTDDAGTDHDLDPTTFGDVFKVGTPVDEEFAIWTGDGTLASTPDITSDGTTMLLTPLIVRVTQNFRSRGLQDNATARRLLVFNNTTQWGAADDDEYSFARVLDTGSMGAAGGSGKTGGGNFIFRGASHSILPGDFSLRSGVAVWLNWDESAGITTFSTGIGNPKTLALTIDASQDAAFEGDVDISGDLQINEPVPTVFWNETNAPVDNRLWAMAADVGQFYIQLVNDAESAAAKVFTIDRTLNVADLFTFTGDVDVIGDVDISGTETVDSLVQPVVKIIDIGDWNMDTTASLSVAHGLTLANIRSVLVTIRNDADTLYTMLPTIDTTALSNERVEFDGTNVIMLRSLSGTFDGTDYDATSYNRGWITIQYVQ